MIIGIFNGLAAAVDQTYPGEFSKQEIKQNLSGWVEKMETTSIADLKSDKSSKAFEIVNLTISNAMKTTFHFISIIFLIGFIISLFIRPFKINESKEIL